MASSASNATDVRIQGKNKKQTQQQRFPEAMRLFFAAVLFCWLCWGGCHTSTSFSS
jgi:hypothetical protein